MQERLGFQNKSPQEIYQIISASVNEKLQKRDFQPRDEFIFDVSDISPAGEGIAMRRIPPARSRKQPLSDTRFYSDNIDAVISFAKAFGDYSLISVWLSKKR